MMSLGAVVAIPIAWILKKTYFRGETPPFVMELPSYKWPSPRIVLSRVWDRALAFVTRAGTLIFATTLVVWALGYFPHDRSRLEQVTRTLELLDDDAPLAEAQRTSLEGEQNRLAGEAIANSFLGIGGRAIEPAVRPLGWDWRIGVGVIASFPAREVIISTLGTVYSLGADVEEGEGKQRLAQSLQAARWPNGQPVYTLPVALSIMVFFALCAQCASTLMIIRRETNSWYWPVFTFPYMTVLAYVGALLTYQVASLVL
jgi:ferrous iron transport protein B